MEYRSAEVRQRLEEVGREASMLHMDVLLLIYHFARYGAGNVLEIGRMSADRRSPRRLVRVSLARRRKSLRLKPEEA